MNEQKRKQKRHLQYVLEIKKKKHELLMPIGDLVSKETVYCVGLMAIVKRILVRTSCTFDSGREKMKIGATVYIYDSRCNSGSRRTISCDNVFD